MLEQGWNSSLQEGSSPGAGLKIPALRLLFFLLMMYTQSSGSQCPGHQYFNDFGKINLC